jgi:hypothetical protein
MAWASTIVNTMRTLGCSVCECVLDPKERLLDSIKKTGGEMHRERETHTHTYTHKHTLDASTLSHLIKTTLIGISINMAFN